MRRHDYRLPIAAAVQERTRYNHGRMDANSLRPVAAAAWSSSGPVA